VATFEQSVAVNHDHGLADHLRYVTAGGTQIKDAQVRIYFKSDYDAQRLGAPVGVTTTTATGRWKDPIFVQPGFTYVVQFFKPNEFGPDTATIVV
jgi:hypothetical protein